MKMNKKLRRILLTVCSAALLVCVTVGATVAYLTSSDTVTNTFTVGNVQIKLDEAQANADGSLTDNGTTRVKANTYKLLPGHTYSKDPMVTVLDGSEKCYVKMTVTFTESAALDAIFDKLNEGKSDDEKIQLTSIFNGYSSTNWIAKGNKEDETANTRTYEFWYNGIVDASNDDVELDALFDSITVPGSITNTQLANLEGMKIIVNAYAIQADGFKTADAAWAAYAAK